MLIFQHKTGIIQLNKSQKLIFQRKTEIIQLKIAKAKSFTFKNANVGYFQFRKT